MSVVVSKIFYKTNILFYSIMFYYVLLYYILFYSMHASIILQPMRLCIHAVENVHGKYHREKWPGGCLFINLLVEISARGECPDAFDQMSKNVPPKVDHVLFGTTKRPGMNLSRAKFYFQKSESRSICATSTNMQQLNCNS